MISASLSGAAKESGLPAVCSDLLMGVTFSFSSSLLEKQYIMFAVGPLFPPFLGARLRIPDKPRHNTFVGMVSMEA